MDCEISRAMSKEMNKYKNVDHMGAEAATVHSSAGNAEITKSDFKSPSKTFFSQEKISLMRTRKHASECDYSQSRDMDDEVVRTGRAEIEGGRHSRARERDRKISRDAREGRMKCVGRDAFASVTVVL
jgi:hypothetical protein